MMTPDELAAATVMLESIDESGQPDGEHEILATVVSSSRDHISIVTSGYSKDFAEDGYRYAIGRDGSRVPYGGWRIRPGDVKRIMGDKN